MYAIVDIETTGGFAGQSRITEIAILVYDGNQVVETYETLINPEQEIPAFITGLTGIDQQMVDQAPLFEEVAEKVHQLLVSNIFVAHNVHFDYSFVKRELENCGYSFNPKKVCTVRLSRKIIPGMRSYSLGKLCEQLLIKIDHRHRAGGDAKATTVLFEKLLKKNAGVVAEAINRNSGETKLPPNLPKEEYENLPEQPGVYYFIDDHAKIIYVGKAINIKKRITSHFSGTSKNKRNQAIRNEIHHINYELTGNELIALLFESSEIKRLWPKYNRAQKFQSKKWGIYLYEDREGFLRFNINKITKGMPAAAVFHSHTDAWQFLLERIAAFELCPKLCGIQKSTEACFDYKVGKCLGACVGKESAEDYNIRFKEALATFNPIEKSFAILERGRNQNENAVVLIDNGVYNGFGFIEKETPISTIDEVRNVITTYKSTLEIEQFIASYINNSNAKIIEFS